jgi:hypothetical protein
MLTNNYRELENARKKMATIIWSDLERVGHVKAIGYLPLYTIKTYFEKSLEELIVHFANKSLAYFVLEENEGSVKSGALYIYNPGLVEKIMQEHKLDIAAHCWPSNVHECVRKIASEWLNFDHPLLPFIRKLFDDL